MFGLTVVTAPTEEPLGLSEVKRQVRIADNENHFNSELTGLIVAARVYCEVATQKAFCTQELRLTRDCFPSARQGYEFRLPRPPLQTLTPDATYTDLGIFYTDTAGDEQEIDASLYVVDPTPEVGRIGLAFGQTWPETIEQIASVRVQYLAGYGGAEDVPQTIKQAMLLLIAHWFENKEAASARSIQPIAFALKELLGCNWTGSMVGAYG